MPAVGRQPAATPWFKDGILDLGAPGPYQLDPATDQAPVIRAAMDWLIANHPNRAAVLRFPQGSYPCYGLIRCGTDQYISFQGHDAGTNLYANFPDGRPVVWDSFGRAVLDAATFWRDTTGLYDGSVTAPRYGLALPRAGCAGWMAGDGFDWWPGDGSDTQLTISAYFQLEQYATYTPAVLTLCSVGDDTLADGVFNLGLTPVYDQLNLFVHSADGSARYDATLGIADYGARHRIDVQWDSTGTVGAWVDGVQVAVTPGIRWSASPRSATGALRRNDRFPFLVNSGGNKLRLGQDAANYAPSPLAVYGLHVSRARRFTPGAAGSPIVWAATGAAPTDLQRYFTPDASTAGLLPLTDPPPAAGVKVPPFWRALTGGGESIWGVACPPPQNVRADWFSPTFEPCSYAGTSGISFSAYRTAYMCGQMDNRSFTNVGFDSTAGSGLGQFEVFASFYNYLNGCSFAGMRDDVQLASNIATLTDCTWPSSHTPYCNLRTMGSEVLLIAPKIHGANRGPYALELWGGDYTGPFTTISKMTIDNEVYQSPTAAIIGAHPGGPSGGGLFLDQCDLGGGTAASVGVELRDPPATAGQASTPTGLSIFRSVGGKIWHNSAYVRVTGPSWRGEIVGFFAVTGAEADVVLDAAAGDDCGLVVHRDDSSPAPRLGRYVCGRSELAWAAAGPGMVRRWVCTRSGDDRAALAAERPLWAAAEVMPAMAGEMAGYGWRGRCGSAALG